MGAIKVCRNSRGSLPRPVEPWLTTASGKGPVPAGRNSTASEPDSLAVFDQVRLEKGLDLPPIHGTVAPGLRSAGEVLPGQDRPAALVPAGVSGQKPAGGRQFIGDFGNPALDPQHFALDPAGEAPPSPLNSPQGVIADGVDRRRRAVGLDGFEAQDRLEVAAPRPDPGSGRKPPVDRDAGRTYGSSGRNIAGQGDAVDRQVGLGRLCPRVESSERRKHQAKCNQDTGKTPLLQNCLTIQSTNPT